jgi:hypothetical protein
MHMTRLKRHRTATTIAGALAAPVLLLSACSDTAGEETGASVEDIQEDADAGVAEEPLAEEPAAEEPLAEEGVAEEPLAEEGVAEGDALGFDEVGADTESFVGQEVTVSAEVNEQLSENAFTIAGEDSALEPLLVVSATGPMTIVEGDAVQVSGTVMQAFDLPTVEQELGVDLQDDLFTEFEQQPYIQASAVDSTVAAEN